MKRTVLPSLILMLVAIIPISAEVLYVPDDFSSIQYAIYASENGDKIIVKPGTYEENIDFFGKNITISSTEPENPNIVATTIIQGDKTSSVVTFKRNETNQAILT